MFTQKFLISVILVGICCAVPASAALVTCTTVSCFAAASTADTFQNIDVTAGSLGDSYTDPTTAEFEDLMGLNGIVNPTGWPTGTAIAANAGANTMTITLPSSVNAIEFYGGALDFTDMTLSVTDSTGGTYTNGLFGQTNVMNPLFFGVVTNSTFTSITITSYASVDQITLDDISVGSAGSGEPAPTPEAATLLLVATGLFMMSYFRRRTFAQAASRGHQAANDLDQAAKRGTVRTMSTRITPA